MAEKKNPWASKFLTPAEIAEMTVRADLDHPSIKNRKLRGPELARAVQDRELLLLHIQALEWQYKHSREHISSPDCWCRPDLTAIENGVAIYTHHKDH